MTKIPAPRVDNKLQTQAPAFEGKSEATVKHHTVCDVMALIGLAQVSMVSPTTRCARSSYLPCVVKDLVIKVPWNFTALKMLWKRAAVLQSFRNEG